MLFPFWGMTYLFSVERALKSNSVLSKRKLHNCTEVIQSINKCQQRVQFSQVLMKHIPRDLDFSGDLSSPVARPKFLSDTQGEVRAARRTLVLWEDGLPL